MTITAAINPYLSGNFAPVLHERDDDELEVTGAIPPELVVRSYYLERRDEEPFLGARRS
jgi:carotenoid cleavage dioxygenase-like enzyme